MIPFNMITATRYGHMIYHAHDLFVGQSLQLYGEFSPGEMDLYRFLLEPGDVVLEGGANLGALTIPIAQRVGDNGLVIAYEPQRLTFQALCGNLALNNLVHVVAFNHALGAEPGTTHCPAANITAQDNVGGISMDPTKPANTTVVTIDSMELPRLDLLKLDIEGGELDALKGAVKTLARCRPYIVVETDHMDSGPPLLDFLRAQGYTLYEHRPPLYRADNWRGIELNAWPNVVSINALCVPNEDQQPGKIVRANFGLVPLDGEPTEEAA